MAPISLFRVIISKFCVVLSLYNWRLETVFDTKTTFSQIKIMDVVKGGQEWALLTLEKNILATPMIKIDFYLTNAQEASLKSK